eukprot:6884054-Pyramimonas_sp.AAC.1
MPALREGDGAPAGAGSLHHDAPGQRAPGGLRGEGCGGGRRAAGGRCPSGRRARRRRLTR